MGCPKCNAEMKARVIFDKLDGELNLLECSGRRKYTIPIFQPFLMAIMASRARVSMLMQQV